MRFGLPADSSDDETSSVASFVSSRFSDTGSTSYSEGPDIGKSIRTIIDDSDTEDSVGDDSDDEVVVGVLGSPKRTVQQWRDTTATRRSRRSVKAESSSAPWKRRARMIVEPLIPNHQASPYEGWLRTSEEQAMREGTRIAHERQNQLQQATMLARQSVRSEEQARLDRDAEDMRNLLEAMAIKQHEDEQEVAKRFAEREKRLWEDIDAAIKEVERKEAELRRAAEDATKKMREEEQARTAKAESEAKSRREEDERKQREKAENDKRSKEEEQRRQEEQERQRAGEAQKREEEEKMVKAKTQTGTEWRKWVEKQRWMKKEVIGPMKANRETLMPLKKIMRLMGRGLGQIVNTQEGILRVTAEMHNHLCGQLPSPPSIANPATLDNSPKPYLYLLSHMSKSLIKQAESEVSASPSAAYPLGRVVMLLLLNGHAAFGDILFARLVKKCPWVIPYYPSRGKDQPRDEYEKSTGRPADESLPDYIARMNGIFTLYLAIIQTPIASLVPVLVDRPTKEQLVQLVCPPLRFTAAWTWLAFACRDPLPALPPTATLISTWVKQVGREAINVFGRKQMMKMFEAIQVEGVKGEKMKGDSVSAREQLGMLLEGVERLTYPQARTWQ